jgi:hypothetical protein
MAILKTLWVVLLFLIGINTSAQKKAVDHFDKIIVSPYIQVTFIQGNGESVAIDNIKVDQSKLHIDVANKTLHIYLEGAKDIPKNEKDYSNGYKETHSLYDKTTVVATITYKTLTELSIRGEEEQVCKSPITANKFTLRIYGESKITFNELNLQQLHTTMYGGSTLEIKAGSIKEQQYTCYGDGKINTLANTGRLSRITAYGNADLMLNVSERIKITAFGEAKVHYKGNPEIVKGLHFGDLSVDKID